MHQPQIKQFFFFVFLESIRQKWERERENDEEKLGNERIEHSERTLTAQLICAWRSSYSWHYVNEKLNWTHRQCRFHLNALILCLYLFFFYSFILYFSIVFFLYQFFSPLLRVIHRIIVGISIPFDICKKGMQITTSPSKCLYLQYSVVEIGRYSSSESGEFGWKMPCLFTRCANQIQSLRKHWIIKYDQQEK